MPGARTAWTAWAGHALRPRALPVDRPLAIRGAIGISVPLAIGLATGHPAYGAVAALGAYGAALDDSSAPYRVRALNLFWPQLASAVGLCLGRFAGGQAWAEILLMGCVALVSALISRIGPVSSLSGLVLLLASVSGLGMPTDEPWWKLPLLFFVGGVPLALMSLAGWPAQRHRAERATVAAAYRAAADLVAAPAAPADQRREARRRLTAVMDQAYDLLVVRRLRAPAPRSPVGRLVARLDALIAVLAALPSVRDAAPEVRERYAARLRALADSHGTPAPWDPPGEGPLDRALREAALDGPALRGGHLDPPPGRGPLDPPPGRDRLGPHPAPLRRLRTVLDDVLRTPATWSFAVRLSAGIAVAQAVASLSGLPKSPWLVVTVALVLRPDLGTVTARVLLRGLGTLGGVLVGAGILALVPDGWWRIPVIAVLLASLQAVGRRTYVLQCLFLTPIMILLADAMGHQGESLAGYRMLDVLIGCAIALAFGYLLWPDELPARIRRQFGALEQDLAEYGACAPAGDRNAVHIARRRAHQRIARLHEELSRARTDPRHHGSLDGWRSELAAAEDRMDQLTHAYAHHT